MTNVDRKIVCPDVQNPGYAIVSIHVLSCYTPASMPQLSSVKHWTQYSCRLNNRTIKETLKEWFKHMFSKNFKRDISAET